LPASKRDNPYSNFNFIVEIDGKNSGEFLECSGLGSEVQSVDYRGGSDSSSTLRKVTGVTKFVPVTLKRGLTNDTALWEWHKNVVDGLADQRDVTVTLLDEARKPVIKWVLRRAVPLKWIGPTLNAKSNEVAVESVELVYEGLDATILT
jgi:phage tail-like protein